REDGPCGTRGRRRTGALWQRGGGGRVFRERCVRNRRRGVADHDGSDGAGREGDVREQKALGYDREDAHGGRNYRERRFREDPRCPRRSAEEEKGYRASAVTV